MAERRISGWEIFSSRSCACSGNTARWGLPKSRRGSAATGWPIPRWPDVAKMEDRGWSATAPDRRFIYEPSVAADDVARTMSGDLVDRLFDGSLARTVSHLLKTREVDRRELDELED